MPKFDLRTAQDDYQRKQELERSSLKCFATRRSPSSSPILGRREKPSSCDPSPSNSSSIQSLPDPSPSNSPSIQSLPDPSPSFTL